MRILLQNSYYFYFIIPLHHATMIFAQRLKQLRSQQQLTQQQMSERLNMDQSTYSRYENGNTIPAIDVILRIVEEFNVSADWLLGNDKKLAM